MNILVTSIGSMSAQCVISSLRKLGHVVIGTDIYPKEWHIETKLCSEFYQIPLCKDKEYVPALQRIVSENKVTHIIPLTDVEIDVLDENRYCFEKCGVTLCMPSHEIIGVVRDKYNLYNFFRYDNCISMPKTYLKETMEKVSFIPMVAKIRNGRSSEGLFLINSKDDFQYILKKENYIIQEKIDGIVVTVDFIRNCESGDCVVIPRKELLRTSNGAGLTVELFNDEVLTAKCKYIGEKLNINGCVNLEFIKTGARYYLIDINPRFSAGVAFSYIIGYDFPKNNLFCYTKQPIDSSIIIKQTIIVKKYVEQVVN